MSATIRRKESDVTREDVEYMYLMQVVTLINIARQIRDGHGEEVAKDIEARLPAYLGVTKDFKESNLKTATYYAGGKLLNSAKRSIPSPLARVIKKYTAKQAEALSPECHPLAPCGGGRGCIPFPTSLRPVDPKKTDEMGWRFIVGSHCGFKWFKPWRNCGNPIGLYQCSPPD